MASRSNSPKINKTLVDSAVPAASTWFVQDPDVKAECARAKALAAATEALIAAAISGTADCVRRLIPISNPKRFQSAALRWAAVGGHAGCVKLLIPVSEPKDSDSYSLRWAACNGHAECVRLLIPVSDPTADDSRALRWAAAKGNAECFEMLIPVSGHLLEMPDVLSEVIDSGRANILSIMLAREPRFLASLDLVHARDAAEAKRQPELAALISSIIEQKTLAENLPLPEAISPPTTRRL